MFVVKCYDCAKLNTVFEMIIENPRRQTYGEQTSCTPMTLSPTLPIRELHLKSCTCTPPVILCVFMLNLDNFTVYVMCYLLPARASHQRML